MFNWIYYTIRNLWYYRKQRAISHEHIMNISRANATLDEMQFTCSDALLATVGLKRVKDDKDTIPWYIPLSGPQRKLVASAKRWGDKVGLR